MNPRHAVEGLVRFDCFRGGAVEKLSFEVGQEGVKLLSLVRAVLDVA